MGRKVKYTEKEKKELNKKRCKDYYERNKERIKTDRMSRYWYGKGITGYVSSNKRQKEC